MHKSFYASGFFYHSASKRILLQQLSTGGDVKFTLFRGSSEKGHDPQEVFRQSVEEVLGMTISASAIRPVYDYVHEKFGAHFIFYVEVEELTSSLLTDTHEQAKWISLSKLSKHNMSEQTRHDIVVGERVIRALEEQKHAFSQV